MTWRRFHSWMLACDRCRDAWLTYADDPYPRSRTSITAYAASQGWVFVDDAAICSACTQTENCAITGHVWGQWMLLNPTDVEDTAGATTSVRFCRICTLGQVDEP